MQVYQLLYTIDRLGYNLLHQCAFFKRFDMLVFLIEHFKVCCRFILIQNDQFSSPKPSLT
jgi:hypothetical protein